MSSQTRRKSYDPSACSATTTFGQAEKKKAADCVPAAKSWEETPKEGSVIADRGVNIALQHEFLQV